ncbi:hypothetical protein LINGRAHAP2_LOCUS2660 [Linum grandiflorum]
MMDWVWVGLDLVRFDFKLFGLDRMRVTVSFADVTCLHGLLSCRFGRKKLTDMDGKKNGTKSVKKPT